MHAEERHPAPDTWLDLVRTAGLGFSSGLRAIMPWAVLAFYLEREGPDIADGGWALDLLSSRRTALVLGAAALGEWVIDKLPFAPSRLGPGPLTFRVISGGTAAALAGLAQARRSDSGALSGSFGAIAGSLAGYALRTRVPLPQLLLALAEDGVAFMLARWALQH